MREHVTYAICCNGINGISDVFTSNGNHHKAEVRATRLLDRDIT